MTVVGEVGLEPGGEGEGTEGEGGVGEEEERVRGRGSRCWFKGAGLVPRRCGGLGLEFVARGREKDFETCNLG